MKLLPIKVRAAMRHDMDWIDWIHHGWYCLTSARYRRSVRQLKEAFELPDDPYLVEATKDLRRAKFDGDGGVMTFTPREDK
jgi:hypothetical protein